VIAVSPARGQAIRVRLPDEPAALSLVCASIGQFRAELVEDPPGSWSVDFHADHRLRSRLERDLVAFLETWIAEARLAGEAVRVEGVAPPGDSSG
jgi:hypothetical protein